MHKLFNDLTGAALGKRRWIRRPSGSRIATEAAWESPGSASSGRLSIAAARRSPDRSVPMGSFAVPPCCPASACSMDICIAMAISSSSVMGAVRDGPTASACVWECFRLRADCTESPSSGLMSRNGSRRSNSWDGGMCPIQLMRQAPVMGSTTITAGSALSLYMLQALCPASEVQYACHTTKNASSRAFTDLSDHVSRFS
mmetsp:Transcript_1931/g.4563  ORF Transcript_1931/g.4563 Transcript_1931/m.4563 type:complete len:200 (-) Transcript_1931:1028-1627(-)